MSMSVYLSLVQGLHSFMRLFNRMDFFSCDARPLAFPHDGVLAKLREAAPSPNLVPRRGSGGGTAGVSAAYARTATVSHDGGFAPCVDHCDYLHLDDPEREAQDEHEEEHQRGQVPFQREPLVHEQVDREHRGVLAQPREL